MEIEYSYSLFFMSPAERNSISLNGNELISMLQARKPGGADLFICYGGVLLREAVAAKADWVVLSFEELWSPLK